MAADQSNSVAIYAAALSTLVALWNFYQWWLKGPKLAGFLSPNMVTFGGMPDDNTYVVVTVSNRGDATTTITNLGLLGYSSWYNYIREKTAKAAVVGAGGLGSPIPSALAPGNEFKGFAIQNTELEEWSRKYMLYMCVWHTMSNKPYRVRLKPIVPKKGGRNG